MKRTSSPYLDSILGESFPLLDHGFIRVIDYMGDDSSIVQAARVSYGEGTKTVSDDRGLIRYLMREHHTSPFEMCEIKIHVKMPIFVARQWIRHRTASLNEYSGRYSEMGGDFYIPEEEAIQPQSERNKQGREEVFDSTITSYISRNMKELCEDNYSLYRNFLGLGIEEENGFIVPLGLSRELARIILPLSTYTEMYWKMDLHNLLHFILLRSSEAAQYEIRVYAEELLRIVKQWVPETYQAFMDYRKNASTFSEVEVEIIQELIGKNSMRKPKTFSDREWKEFSEKIDLIDEYGEGND